MWAQDDGEVLLLQQDGGVRREGLCLCGGVNMELGRDLRGYRNGT